MAKKKSFVIWGLGRFGSSVALTLTELGHDVLGIDNSEEKVQEFSDKLTHTVLCDMIDENTFKTLGIRNFDVGIVGMADLESSLMCTMLMKEHGLKTIVAKSSSPLHGTMLKKIGADLIIYPERDMGYRVAHNLSSSNILDYIELSDDISLMEIHVLASMVGKNLIEADVRRKYGVNVVAVKHEDGTTDINMDPTIPFKQGDILIVIGTKNTMLALESGL